VKRVRDIGEFGLIERIARKLPRSERSIIGMGDDAAAVMVPTDNSVLVTTDMIVEDVHFTRKISTPQQVGWRCVAAGISDIAAMGGIPWWALVSLAIPEDCDVAWVDGLYDGMIDMASRYSVEILGGDTSRSKDKIYIDAVTLGQAPIWSLATRSLARPDEMVYVTGEPGRSAAGLEILTSRPSLAERFKPLVEAHLRPLPAVREAHFLAETGPLGAMIDISDGLMQDMRHICRLSGVGARIEADRLPICDTLRDYCDQVGKNQLDYVLAGGEDYDLIFTCEEDSAHKLEKLWAKRFGNRLRLTHIGTVTEPSHGLKLVDAHGKEVPFTGGHDHFLKKRGHRPG